MIKTRTATGGEMIRVISMFSGMEAASVAARDLNWKFLAFSEIDPAACFTLHSLYGCGRPVHMPMPDDVDPDASDAEEQRDEREAAIRAVSGLPDAKPGHPINWGDISQTDWSRYHGQVDLVVGGPPCVAFSVAGLRGSLTDVRGNLTLEYMKAVHAIEPLGCLTEQVPGIFSTKDNAFGCYLGGIVGHDSPLVPSKGQRWTREGVVAGPRGVAAWRCLDAQGFVPQRRLRVFLLHSRDVSRLDPVRVLFETEADALRGLGNRAYTGPLFPEREGVRWDTAAGGSAGQDASGIAEGCAGTGFVAGVAPTIPARTKSGGGLGTDFDCDGGLVAAPIAYGGGNTAGPITVSTAMTAHPGGRYDFDSETFVATAVTGDIPILETGARMAVRRLLPTECLKLQSFPPDYFDNVTYRGKPLADGNKHKMIGNSWNTDTVRWIFRRIDAEWRNPAKA